MCSVTVSFVLSRINAYISMIAANCQELYSLRDYNNTTTEELKKKKTTLNLQITSQNIPTETGEKKKPNL